MIGLTFGDTTYGTGVGGGSPTFKRGGLSPKGFELLSRMGELGFVWDISHPYRRGRMARAGHGIPPRLRVAREPRALIPTDRHLSDAVIRAVAGRAGVIGLVLYNGFLEPRWRRDRSIPVTLDEHLRRHADHVAGLVGWKHAGIGSDLDGGFGLEESPSEIDTVADLHRAGAAMPAEAEKAVLSTNWLNFLRSSLPRTP